MIPFNLLSDPFLPVVMRSGAQRWLSFPELGAGTESDNADYPVEFNWPRPDFNMASFEFCVGVISLAFDIRDEDDWRPFWTNPPDRAALAERLAPLVHAFNLNGEGPRFLQDYESLQGDETPIELLLIDTPGQNGQRKNSDLLTPPRPLSCPWPIGCGHGAVHPASLCAIRRGWEPYLHARGRAFDGTSRSGGSRRCTARAFMA